MSTSPLSLNPTVTPTSTQPTSAPAAGAATPGTVQQSGVPSTPGDAYTRAARATATSAASSSTPATAATVALRDGGPRAGTAAGSASGVDALGGSPVASSAARDAYELAQAAGMCSLFEQCLRVLTPSANATGAVNYGIIGEAVTSAARYTAVVGRTGSTVVAAASEREPRPATERSAPAPAHLPVSYSIPS